MKKIIIALSLFILCAVSFAQNHASILGVEFSEPKTMVQQLKNKGFSTVIERENAIGMTGRFCGVDNCNLYLLTTEKTKKVWKAAVFFPHQDSWSGLKSRYNELKSSLTNKYGVPENDFHFFSGYYEDGDGHEIMALTLGKCNYCAFYHTENALIEISIESVDVLSGVVAISYEDPINVKIMKEEKETTINQDL